MNDRDRISNLEEMAAEIFIKLDKVENDLKSMKTGWGNLGDRTSSVEDTMLGLSHRQAMLDDSHAILKQSLLALAQVSRKNSDAIEMYVRNTLSNNDLSTLFEYMMKRFDAVDERFNRMERTTDERFSEMKRLIDEGLSRADDRFNRTEEELQKIRDDITTLKADVKALKADIEVLKVDVTLIKKRLDNQD